MMRLDRDTYVDIDYQAMELYEIAKYGSVKNKTKNQYLRCDQHMIGKNRGCQKIGEFDGDSILMYPPTLTAPVLVNGQTVDKNFTAFTLKASAHKLCEGGKCHPGQRDGLSRTDITDIKELYGTTCGKNDIRTFIVNKIDLYIDPLLYIHYFTSFNNTIDIVLYSKSFRRLQIKG